MKSRRWALAGLLGLATIGCGHGVSYYPARGEVTLNGKPYPDATIEFVPDPANPVITAAGAVTDAEGQYSIPGPGQTGLSAGKYKVVVTPRPPEASASGPAFEDEEQRRMALESLGTGPAGQGKLGGEFQAEVGARPNILDFDVKGRTARP